MMASADNDLSFSADRAFLREIQDLKRSADEARSMARLVADPSKMKDCFEIAAEFEKLAAGLKRLARTSSFKDDRSFKVAGTRDRAECSIFQVGPCRRARK